MPIENLNNHTHHNFFKLDFDFQTDATIDEAANRLKAEAVISGKELKEFLGAAGDFGQITNREARQISEWFRRFNGKMDEGARKIVEQFETRFQPLVDELHDSSDEALSGFKHDFIGAELPYHVAPGQDLDDVALGGADLGAFMNELDGRP